MTTYAGGEDRETVYADFRFIDQSGEDITGTSEVAGYFFRDFFDRGLANATHEELVAAYRGPDIDGIGVVWSFPGRES